MKGTMASRIHHRLKRASDLASLSDELHASARGWSEIRELTKSAPNALRALELLPTHRALLVTDGHGALARYLGEACASVDVQGTGDRVRDIAAGSVT